MGTPHSCIRYQNIPWIPRLLNTTTQPNPTQPERSNTRNLQGCKTHKTSKMLRYLILPSIPLSAHAASHTFPDPLINGDTLADDAQARAYTPNDTSCVPSVGHGSPSVTMIDGFAATVERM